MKQTDNIIIKRSGLLGEYCLNIVSKSNDLYENDSHNPGYAYYQLLEGKSYEYSFSSANGHLYQFAERDDIISRSRIANRKTDGTIATGIYVGNLSLDVIDLNSGEKVDTIELEIRSCKADYETDYRTMLNEIAEYYTDLILQQGSPVSQNLSINSECDSATLYQRFAFVRSIIDSDSFAESIHKIISNPVRKWAATYSEHNITSVRRLGRSGMRQLTSRSNRISFSHPDLPSNLTSVPRRITVEDKIDTVDNLENQFVKFVLYSFSSFCLELKDKKNANDRLKSEAEIVISILASFLDTQFFRQVSMPSHINLNSPVLQRKEGYREILQAWLIFDLAARLNWTGGDDVYRGGKKNVAALYEYWLFFKLYELISGFFELEKSDKNELVKADDDSINLDLKQGRVKVLHGSQVSSTRQLNIAFYYNRTFSGSKAINASGSWTLPMRPDYTLSMWPGNICEEDAEKQDLVVHVHFDAKYRLNKILLEQKDGSESEDEFLKNEKEQQEKGIYKRADLLKMHAYKDAIRRTSGAYVLYPGTENRNIQGFHEIIPGLGAFSIRPGHWSEDSIDLRNFLAEVKAHMLDRISQRSKIAYYEHDIHKEEPTHMLMESLPEPVDDNRGFMPDETHVLLGYVNDDNHLNWIHKTGLYNFRAGTRFGSLLLNKEFVSSRYILLHRNGKSIKLVRLSAEGPRVFSRSNLLKKGYPKSSDEEKKKNDIYIVFKLEFNTTEPELEQYYWKMSDINESMGRASALPKPVLLSDLMMKAKK